jgi:hypothetical protein
MPAHRLMRVGDLRTHCRARFVSNRPRHSFVPLIPFASAAPRVTGLSASGKRGRTGYHGLAVAFALSRLGEFDLLPAAAINLSATL